MNSCMGGVQLAGPDGGRLGPGQWGEGVVGGLGGPIGAPIGPVGHRSTCHSDQSFGSFHHSSRLAFIYVDYI